MTDLEYNQIFSLIDKCRISYSVADVADLCGLLEDITIKYKKLREATDVALHQGQDQAE